MKGSFNQTKRILFHCLLGCLLLCSFLTTSSVVAQTGPGVANVPQTKGALLAGPLAPQQGRTAVVAYHQGFIVTVPESPGSAAGSDLLSRAWNFSDPLHPLEQVISGLGPNSGIAAHGYWQEGNLLRSLGGGDYSVVDTNGDSIGEFARVSTPQGLQWYYPRHPTLNIGWVNRGLLFQPFQTQMWWSYGATNAPAVLYKRNTLLATWDHIGQTGVIGHPFLIGNILYIASDQSNTGIAAYDITPSLENPGTPPRLLSVLRAPIGGYWPEMWGGAGKLLILFPARQNAHFFVADVTDPSNMQIVADRFLPSGGDPAYAQFQDNFAFMDRYKIDMEHNFAIDLTLDSDGQGIDVSQFALPVGNLLFTGGYPHTNASQGLAVWAHQAEPDTRGPTVGYHIPRSEQRNYPLSAPISLLIHETLRTETLVNGDTFVVRPLSSNGAPGAPLAGRITFAFDDVLTFAPDNDFLPNTTYEVVLREGGIQDAVGNGMVAYSFRFSTGSGIAGGNVPPVVNAFRTSTYPARPGVDVNLIAEANDANGDSLEYRFSFGDGTPDTDWQQTSSTTHRYPSAAHYAAAVFVRDPSGATAFRRLSVSVLDPLPTNRPVQSSTIAFDAQSAVTWVVNPDNDSLSRVEGPPESPTVREIPLGQGCDPRGVTLDSYRRPWVSCLRSDSLVVLSSSGDLVNRIQLPYGSGPYSVLATPNGSDVFVSLFHRGSVQRFAASDMSLRNTLVLGPTPRAMAITADGMRLLVTRLISPDSEGQVWDVQLGSQITLTRTIALPLDTTTPDTASSGSGLANYLTGVAIHPSGTRAWITSKLDNTVRGNFLSGNDLSQENTVRAIVSEIDLQTNAEVRAARKDVDNSDSPSAVTFSPEGDFAFVSLQGNNVVAVYDVLRPAENEADFVPIVARFGVERAPQGLLMVPGERLLVQNLLSRSLSTLRLGDFLRGESGNAITSPVSLIGQEALPQNVLRGKRLFYNASDTGGAFGRNRMSGEGYISCATCHLDGSHDGRVWDFTGRGEGLRNTTDLRGRRGMGHGRVHWTGNFDEIQDFENDIRNAFGGAGFLTDDQFASTVDTLGLAKSGLSQELDDLAAYVSSLGKEHIPRSPYKNEDGTHTDAGLRGQALFASLGCETCHSPPNFTDSGFVDSLLHDVGTISSSSGYRRGLTLPGIDTPTLLGLWSGAPYFHNGSASTVENVFTSRAAQTLQAETATLLGGAGATGPTYGGIYHEGQVVGFSGTSGSVRWSGVDGGAGGNTEVRLRLAVLYSTQTATLIVNGTSLPLTLARTANNPSWWPSDFREVSVTANLLSGTTNTIEFIPNPSYGAIPIAVDELSVFARKSPDLTFAHSRLSSQTSAEVSDLIRYLRELDGNDDQSNPTPTPTGTPSATPSQTPTATPSGTPTVSPTPIPTGTVSPTPTPTETPPGTPTSQPATPTASATATPTPDYGFLLRAPGVVSVRLGRARGATLRVPVQVLNTKTPGRRPRFVVSLTGAGRPSIQSFQLPLGRSRRVQLNGKVTRRGEQQVLITASGPLGQLRAVVRVVIY